MKWEKEDTSDSQVTLLEQYTSKETDKSAELELEPYTHTAGLVYNIKITANVPGKDIQSSH